MADNTVRGRFVWHELMTPDTSGAHAFYSKVVGWKTQPWEHDPSYQMFAAASGPLGGSVAQPSGTPHWLHYIGTPDIDATVATVKSRGGGVTKEVTSMPNGGKYAVLTDPQGAAFGVYSSPMDSGGKEPPAKRGEFSWHELATSDWRAAIDFYTAVFGWEKQAEHDMGAMGKYVLFGSNGVMRGGMFNKPADMPGGPFWLGYVRVKDVNDAVRKAKGARGALVNGPMEVPGGDWIAQFTDPYGAMFAVHTLAADLQSSQTAAAAGQPAGEGAAAQPAALSRSAAANKAAAQRKTAKAVPARKAPAKKKAAKKKAAKKKTPRKKAVARRAKSARKSAKRTTGRKAAKKRSGGRKKAAGKARKGK
jgi:predicted enzyme related to lactoylglutathione lyase